MKSWWWGTLLVAGVATAACDASPKAPSAPEPPLTGESILTIGPTPVVTITETTSSVPTTISVPVPTSTKKAPVRKTTPTRKPPQYGYQCRDGDETEYEVCAGHKAWVDGQREFTDCLAGGGTWDVDTQRCVRP